MRALLQGMLVILHFWTFCLCPSLQAGFEAYQLQEICNKNPVATQKLENMLISAPELAWQLAETLKALPSSSQPLEKPEPENNKLDLLQNKGNIEIHSDIHAKNSVLISQNNLNIHSTITGNKSIMLALGEMTIESLKKRLYNTDYGWNNSYKDVLLCKAQVLLKEILYAASGGNMTTIGSTTKGGKEHILETGGTFKGLPLTLENYSMQEIRGGDEYRVNTRSSSQPIVSSHEGEINQVLSYGPQTHEGSHLKGKRDH